MLLRLFPTPGAQSADVSLVPLSGLGQRRTKVPLRDVRIELKRLSDGNMLATYTNAAGLFKIEVAEGEYQITAVFRSQKMTKEMNVATGKNWVNLRLNEQPLRVGPSVISTPRLNIPAAARDAFKKARAALENHDPVAAARHLCCCASKITRPRLAISRSLLHWPRNHTFSAYGKG
jgi:hypothetical protein